MATNQPTDTLATVTPIIPVPGLRDPGYSPAEFRAEQWRDVAGFEGKYAISSLGRVWSHGGRRVLKPGFPGRSSSYPAVALYDGRGGCFQRYLHRLVAEAFLPPAPSPAYELDHINGNPADARAMNLRWMTPGENKAASIRLRRLAGLDTGPGRKRGHGKDGFCWQGHSRQGVRSGRDCPQCRSERDLVAYRERASRKQEMRAWFHVFQEVPTRFHDVDGDEKAAA